MHGSGPVDHALPLHGYSALILNADYEPLSYFPLSVVSWQDAVRAIFRGTVHVVSEYERAVRSPGFEMKLPSVVALKDYIHVPRKPAFTRFNVFLRDEWSCQYCGGHCKTSELTFDHVMPRSRGGRTHWDNIVAACKSCNARKGNDLPGRAGTTPIKPPKRPDLYELRNKGRKFPPHFLHESWGDFLYWDTELVET